MQKRQFCNHMEILEGQNFGLESPKMDKVLSIQKENVEASEEWVRFIGKELKKSKGMSIYKVYILY